MKAIVVTQFGPPEVLQLRELEKPSPKDHEVLVRVHATSVGFGDLLVRNFRSVTPRHFNMPFLFWLIAKLSIGLSRPKVTVLGSEFSGTVEAVGKNVTRFKPDDAVFGYLGQTMGAYAEFVCMKETDCIARKPENMTFEQAAVVPYGATMALSLLRSVKIYPGKRVLINGASGGIGAAAVQIAKHSGAQVVGVCGTLRMDFVRSLGADRVVDYTKEDFTALGESFDVVFDVLGKTTFARTKEVLAPDGTLLFASFKTKALMQMLWTRITGGKRVVCAIAPGSRKDLEAVKELIEKGVITAEIDKTFRLDQAADAHRYVEEGQRRGKIAIRVRDI